jgi:hypothetical protein
VASSEDRDQAALTKGESRAIESVQRHLESGKSYIGPVLRVTFPAANTRLDIAHRLGVIPDGYELVFADAEIHATPGVLWTTTIAYLQANAANTHALVRFYVLREDVIDA